MRPVITKLIIINLNKDLQQTFHLVTERHLTKAALVGFDAQVYPNVTL